MKIEHTFQLVLSRDKLESILGLVKDDPGKTDETWVLALTD